MVDPDSAAQTRWAGAGPFRVGDWLCLPDRNTVSTDGQSKRLEPKVMAVLAALARQPGRVVQRQDLLSTVWPDTVVGEQVLSRAVSELRKAFSDDSKQPRFIETIAKGGYRLVAPVAHVRALLQELLYSIKDHFHHNARQ